MLKSRSLLCPHSPLLRWVWDRSIRWAAGPRLSWYTWDLPACRCTPWPGSGSSSGKRRHHQPRRSWSPCQHPRDRSALGFKRRRRDYDTSNVSRKCTKVLNLWGGGENMDPTTCDANFIFICLIGWAPTLPMQDPNPYPSEITRKLYWAQFETNGNYLFLSATLWWTTRWIWTYLKGPTSSFQPSSLSMLLSVLALQKQK